MPALSAELELEQELFSRSVRARASNESNFENQPQFENKNVTEETKFHTFAQAEDNSSESKKAMDPSMLKYVYIPIWVTLLIILSRFICHLSAGVGGVHNRQITLSYSSMRGS